MSDTYDKPPHGWTCFHCGETFTTVGGAQDHFGADPSKQPGCMIRVSLGSERGLLMKLRAVEEQLARHMQEDSDTMRAMHALQVRHSDALQTAEEAGYERGLRAHPARRAMVAVADFIGGAKDRFGRPDAVATQPMREARERVRLLAVEHGVAGGHHTFLDQCAALLRAATNVQQRDTP